MEAHAAIEAVFREESGRILATLIRISGSFDRAEEAMQDALASALAVWPSKGIPHNPAAWITAVAHRRLIDHGRRDKTRREKQDLLRHESAAAPSEPAAEEDLMHVPDDRLRLIFTCCHPALNLQAQVALTLRTLGGLTTPQIAKAFLEPEATVAQRIVRAKRKIQEARIPYEVPAPEALPERLWSVCAVIYLIFNEGYAAASGQELTRDDLSSEAIRLARVLCQLAPEPENCGLLALMLLHDSRRAARVHAGRLVTLEDQDRALWDAEKIAEGLRLLESFNLESAGPYQLQAAIAAVHAQAEVASQTDWRRIAALYEKLLALTPSPVIALNHAVAVAMTDGFEHGLKLIEGLAASGALDDYHLLHAARADILRRMRRLEAAAESYRKALTLATNQVERDFLQARLEEIRTSSEEH